MSYPKINILAENKPYHESLYLCFLAKSIASGYFQRGDFYVVPFLVKGNPNTVHFPDLSYSKKFWRVIANNPNDNLNDLYPKGAIAELQEKLNVKSENKKAIKKLIDGWQKIEKPFFADVAKFLDFAKELEKISEINILPTVFGTRSSFYVTKKAKKNTVWITARTDFAAGNIAKSIIHCLYILKTQKGGEIGEKKFFERMAIVDFVFKDTLFNKYLTTYSPTLRTEIPKIHKLLRVSNTYLKKLGFPPRSHLSLHNGSVFMGQEKLNKYFSKQEEILLCALLTNKGQILSNDSIADLLWAEHADEKYSLEAIAKVIQNLRDKLRELGINKNIIHTVRGKGYFLS